MKLRMKLAAMLVGLLFLPVSFARAGEATPRPEAGKAPAMWRPAVKTLRIEIPWREIITPRGGWRVDALEDSLCALEKDISRLVDEYLKFTLEEGGALSPEERKARRRILADGVAVVVTEYVPKLRLRANAPALKRLIENLDETYGYPSKALVALRRAGFLDNAYLARLIVNERDFHVAHTAIRLASDRQDKRVLEAVARVRATNEKKYNRWLGSGLLELKNHGIHVREYAVAATPDERARRLVMILLNSTIHNWTGTQCWAEDELWKLSLLHPEVTAAWVIKLPKKFGEGPSWKLRDRGLCLVTAETRRIARRLMEKRTESSASWRLPSRRICITVPWHKIMDPANVGNPAHWWPATLERDLADLEDDIHGLVGAYLEIDRKSKPATTEEAERREAITNGVAAGVEIARLLRLRGNVPDLLRLVEEDSNVRALAALVEIGAVDDDIAKAMISQAIAGAKSPAERERLRAALSSLESNPVSRDGVRLSALASPAPPASPWPLALAAALAGLLLGFATAALIFRRRSTGSRP